MPSRMADLRELERPGMGVVTAVEAGVGWRVGERGAGELGRASSLCSEQSPNRTSDRGTKLRQFATMHRGTAHLSHKPAFPGTARRGTLFALGFLQPASSFPAHGGLYLAQCEHDGASDPRPTLRVQPRSVLTQGGPCDAHERQRSAPDSPLAEPVQPRASFMHGTGWDDSAGTSF